MVCRIGVSFTAERLAKAAYEETVGRLFTLFRGGARAPPEDQSARQAADYAVFLRQTPWHRWNFRRNAAERDAAATVVLRDREQRLALGLEYRAKAVYARAIAAAVAAVGPDALPLRAVVSGLPAAMLAAIPEVVVIETLPEGVVIKTPRSRAVTRRARAIAALGGTFVEIAGNDDILITVIAEGFTPEGALHSFPRQGNPGIRHLVLMPVADLAEALRVCPLKSIEHILEY
jgi:hypothetical protein